MRILTALALVASLMLVMACKKESEPGGPGAAPAAQGPVETAPETPAHEATAVRSDETFTLEVPRAASNVPQGGNKSIELSIDRGSNFHQTVTLSFEAPPGLSVSPERPTIAADIKSADITVAADASAALGRHQIKVTAKPETGRPVDMMLEVDVTKP